MPADIDAIIREEQALEQLKWPWMPDWQDIADTMMPGQSDILVLRQPGNTRTRQLFDTTGMWALDMLVANIKAWITNFQQQFFTLHMHSLKGVQEAAQWFREVSETQYRNMIAEEAPIPSAVNEAYRFYCGFGTGCLFIDELPMELTGRLGWRGFQAASMPIGRYVVGENAAGRVDTLYRRLEMTPHQMVQEDEWSLSQSVQDALSEADASSRRWEPRKVLHAIRPRRGRDPRQNDQLNMPWESVYIDVDNHHLMHEGGYPWFPVLCFRWEKLIRHNPFGFGRGHLALPETKTLQLIDHDMLRALSHSVEPSGWLLGASRETINNMSLMPGVMNPLAANGGFVPYNAGQNYEAASLQIEERRQRVLRAYFIDQLQFLPPIDKAQPEPLGTTRLRARAMMRIMGPFLMRYLAEFFNPFIDVTFALNLRAGEFPMPPDSVIDHAVRQLKRIEVEATGTLIQAQKSDEGDAILEGSQYIMGLARELGDPALIRNIDLDETVAVYLRSRGFPESLITDRLFMEEIRQQIEQQRMQAMQQEQQLVEAQTAGAAAPALREIREMAGAG